MDAKATVTCTGSYALSSVSGTIKLQRKSGAKWSDVAGTAKTNTQTKVRLTAVVGAIVLGWSVAHPYLVEVLVKTVRIDAYTATLAVVAGSLTLLLRSATIAVFVLLLVPWLIEPVIVEVFYVLPQLRGHTECLPYLPFQAMHSMLISRTIPVGNIVIGPSGLRLLPATGESMLIVAALVAASTTVFRYRDPIV